MCYVRVQKDSKSSWVPRLPKLNFGGALGRNAPSRLIPILSLHFIIDNKK